MSETPTKFKAARFIALNNIDTERLARRLGISHVRLKKIVYCDSICDRFTASAFAYALNCNLDTILDSATTKEDMKWKRATESQQ